MVDNNDLLEFDWHVECNRLFNPLDRLDVTMALKEICAISLLGIVLMLSLPTVNASSDALSDLKASLSAFDDPRMDTQDLAFYLATHGFDASPRGSYVEVHLVGQVYKLTPQRPGTGALQRSGLMPTGGMRILLTAQKSPSIRALSSYL